MDLHCSVWWDLRNPSKDVALSTCFQFNQALAALMLLFELQIPLEGVSVLPSLLVLCY